VFAFLKKLLGIAAPSVDSIVADITKKAAQLNVVAEAKKLEAEAHDAIVAEKTKLAALARTEIARAESVAAKFRALIA
jgi:hypothetical protein